MRTKLNTDNSTQVWDYSGNTETITDGRLNKWTQSTDGLGHVVKVVEPNSVGSTGGAETDYVYNALGNMTNATQTGVNGETARTRSFSYNTLSRLVSSTNGESGAICYGSWSGGSVGSGTCLDGYDGNGNLHLKTDARGVTTTYSYDVLNRLTSKQYGVTAVKGVDPTPTSCFCLWSGFGEYNGAKLD